MKHMSGADVIAKLFEGFSYMTRLKHKHCENFSVWNLLRGNLADQLDIELHRKINMHVRNQKKNLQ